MKFFVLLFTFFTTLALAVPDQCIQRPGRTQACEHQLYRSANLFNETTGKKENQVVCICLSDFGMLREEPTTDTQKIQHRMELKLLSQLLGLQETEIKELLK